MAFTPQSINWPAKHAVLLVHGIGNASAGQEGAFPLDALHAALGPHADDVAVYRLNYDFVNDWAASKVDFAAALGAMKTRIGEKLAAFGNTETVADYIGDVLWPVVSADIRFAIRDAFVAQLAQIHLDRVEAAFARNDDPLDYRISIVAHSLGCFHTYEGLWATCTTPSFQLMPRSDRFMLDSVILMASPVQLIRSCADAISIIVPDIASLRCVAEPLAIPAELRNGERTSCTRRFVAVTGNHDPVGGHLRGTLLEWAFMNLAGQETVIDLQRVIKVATRDERLALVTSLAGDRTDGLPIDDPHSWTAYITRHVEMMRGLAS